MLLTYLLKKIEVFLKHAPHRALATVPGGGFGETPRSPLEGASQRTAWETSGKRVTLLESVKQFFKTMNRVLFSLFEHGLYGLHGEFFKSYGEKQKKFFLRILRELRVQKV